ncbi:MAG: KamA family radical SAM protein [Minisyncoccia bacterium]
MNLEFKITKHLKKLAQKSEAIRKQFYPSKEENKLEGKSFDPLKEESRSPVKGLIHRYPNRVLVLLTLNCAAYCRFCFRRRVVSDIQKGSLNERDLNRMVSYLKKHPQIKEVIISGGDPLTQPKLLELFLRKIVNLKQIKIIRIGTRLPVSDPQRINDNLLRVLRLIKKQPLYILLHFEHPDEITKETRGAIKKLRSLNAILLSQSVFLKGINDDVKILDKLFTELLSLGIKPYYIFHNDEPKGTKHFTVDFKKEIQIMTKLRERLSGLACPMYVYDDPNSQCKIPVPLDFDYSFIHSPQFLDKDLKDIK